MNKYTAILKKETATSSFSHWGYSASPKPYSQEELLDKIVEIMQQHPNEKLFEYFVKIDSTHINTKTIRSTAPRYKDNSLWDTVFTTSENTHMLCVYTVPKDPLPLM